MCTACREEKRKLSREARNKCAETHCTAVALHVRNVELTKNDEFRRRQWSDIILPYEGDRPEHYLRAEFVSAGQYWPQRLGPQTNVNDLQARAYWNRSQPPGLLPALELAVYISRPAPRYSVSNLSVLSY